MTIYMINSRFPVMYTDIIAYHADYYGLDPILITSIINVESGFNRTAVSPAGASGLMQIMEPTANWIAQEMGFYDFDYEQMIFDPDINIKMGTWYINRLINIYSNLDVALAAYNAGSGRVNSWLVDPEFSSDGETLSHIPFTETRNYVRRMDINMRIYRVLARGSFR